MSAAAKNSMAAPTGYVGLHGEMRRFYLAYPRPGISQTASGKLELSEVAQAFSLHWSAYARLLLVKDEPARRFYEAEALRGVVKAPFRQAVAEKDNFGQLIATWRR